MWKRKLDQGIPLLLNRYAIGGEFVRVGGFDALQKGLSTLCYVIHGLLARFAEVRKVKTVAPDTGPHPKFARPYTGKDRLDQTVRSNVHKRSIKPPRRVE